MSQNSGITLSFIGGGNMAEAILRGMLSADLLPAPAITVCDISAARREHLSTHYGVTVTDDPVAAAAAGSMVILAVKPNVCSFVLEQVREELANKALLSIVAGWQTARLRALLAPSTRVLRIMPNTPALVGAGMSVLCSQSDLRPEEMEFVTRAFDALGRTLQLPEQCFDAVTAVSGSGPAYVFMMIEAMADGGVSQGLPRPVALELAAQTVLGAAQMVLQTNVHPGALKDSVCSPGGTTIEAVYALEKAGFRGALMEAVRRCAEKSAELGQR